MAALRQAGGRGCYLYSPDAADTSGAVAYTRFFNPAMGIREDQAHVSDARDGQRQPVGTGRRTETALGALHLTEEVAAIGGQVALARRPPSCDAGSEGTLGQRRRWPATGA